MTTHYIFCVLLISFIFDKTCYSAQSQILDEDDYVPYVDTGLKDDFDWQLLKTFSLNPNYKNVIISPISLKIVLALLYEGAGGTTEKEIQNVLGFHQNKTIVRQEFAKIIESLQNYKKIGCDEIRQTEPPSKSVFNLGTKIFLDANIQPVQSFQSKACEKYQTRIEPTNFNDSERASASVNNWVNKITVGKISKLVNPDDVKDAVLLIANAIYFKGMWRHQFPKNQTHYGGFYLSPANIANVQYMATTDQYFFIEAKNLDAKMIRIPYKDSKFSMIIILPNAKAGLPNLIQRLNVANLRDYINIMDKMSVDLILPKFKYDFQARMTDALKNMGLQSIFQDTASLAGIARGNGIKLTVTDVIQKSGIEVNEEGSVAYAATDVQIVNKFGEAQAVFNATHPFLFFIEDQKTHTILFVGKVEDPLDAAAVPLPSRFGGTTEFDQTNSQPIFESSGGQQNANRETNEGTLNLNQANSQTQPPFQLNPSSWSEPEQTVTKRFNFFDLELLREVASDDNVFISPASIKATLGMLLEGANGMCAEEIVKTLRLPLNQNDARNQLKPLLYDLSDKSTNSVLESANGMFISNRLNVIEGYRRKIEEYYRGFVRSVDFSNSNAAAAMINNWVSNSTRGLIGNLITPDLIGPELSLFVTNALFFKGVWKYAFDEKMTATKCFQLPTRACQMAYMMQNTAEIKYNSIDEIDAHALEIPYSDDKYAMLILLPRIKNSVHALMKDLQHTSFGTILDKLEFTEVYYEIPRFTIDFNVDMTRPLKSLGIKQLFEERANLTGIVANEKLFVDAVLHKTRIDVNERGTTAAAATGAVVVPLMGSSKPRIIADHPFAFFIYKKDNRNVLFEGIVNKPTDATRQNRNYIPNRYSQQ